ncbi:MAG: LysR substrate-binding domain-containing protein [Steroidobacteraceae bacterium]
MKLTHLRDIAAVAERGSLRGAARQLGITQPAISRSIREVEHDLGVALFERRAKGVILTPMGEAFLRRALVVQNELRRAREEIEQMKGQTAGHVTIALSTIAHIALLPKALDQFRAQYPDVFLRISEEQFMDVEGGLKDGTFDFYVGPLSETSLAMEFTVEKLFDNTRLVFCRKGHALAGAKSLRDLTSARWITTSITFRSQAELGPLFEQYGLPAPRVEMQAHSALTMIIAAASSDLLVMLPKQWRDFPATHALLDAIEIEEKPAAAPICIVRRAQMPLTPAAEYMCDMLRRAGQQHLSPDTRAKI